MQQVTQIAQNAVALTMLMLFFGLIIFALSWGPSTSRDEARPMRNIFTSP